MFDVFVQDLHYAARRLWRSPGFTLAAVLTLTLAIGVNTAVYSVVDRVLLRPLDVPEPHRLVVVWETSPRLKIPLMYASLPTLRDWQTRARSFDAIGGFSWRSVTLGTEDAEQVSSVRATAGLLEALGVQPAWGRLFLPEEHRTNARPVALISDALWRRRFGANPQSLGRMVQIDGVATQIVGIMPPGFGYPPPLTPDRTPPVKRADVWTPLATDVAGERNAHFLTVLARLRPDVGLAAASREMEDIATQIAREAPEARDWRVSVVPLTQEMLVSTGASITLLAAAVGCMLLLASANIANLILARGVSRQREIGVRVALGARPGRLAAQMLTESLVLAICGCAGGLLLARLLVGLIVSYGPPTVPGLREATINLRVLVFTIAVSLLVAILTGLAPALSAMRARLNAWLTERGAMPGAGGLRLQQTLAIGQVALAAAVLVVAGLLLESFQRLARVDPGFRVERLVTAKTYLPRIRYGNDAALVGFLDRLLRQAQAQSGLSSVAIGDGVPLVDRRQGGPVWRADRPKPEEPLTSNVSWITEGYVETLRMPLLRGRTLTSADTADTPKVVVINHRLASLLFGDEDPIGRQMTVGNPGGVFEVVGVVGDDRSRGLGVDPAPTSFISIRQRPRPREIVLFARAEGSPEASHAVLRQVVIQLDPALPFYEAQTMEQVVSTSLATPRSLLWLMSGFALWGLLLAGIGVFGVVSHAVGQRTQEIGVRLALGATRAHIMAMVLRQGLVQVGVGVVIGFAIAAVCTQLAASLLFGVTSLHLTTYIVVGGLLALVGIVASLVPALRAIQVDPVTAVRAV